jgi:hypothetical protein
MESTAELMDMVLTDGSPEEVSDKIKQILFSKSSQIIDDLKPHVAQDMFGQTFEQE